MSNFLVPPPTFSLTSDKSLRNRNSTVKDHPSLVLSPPILKFLSSPIYPDKSRGSLFLTPARYTLDKLNSQIEFQKVYTIILNLEVYPLFKFY